MPGHYPIHNKFGRQLYTIECPECFGTGMTDDELEQEQRCKEDRQKYAAAMAEMRGTNQETENQGPIL